MVEISRESTRFHTRFWYVHTYYVRITILDQALARNARRNFLCRKSVDTIRTVSLLCVTCTFYQIWALDLLAQCKGTVREKYLINVQWCALLILFPQLFYNIVLVYFICNIISLCFSVCNSKSSKADEREETRASIENNLKQASFARRCGPAHKARTSGRRHGLIVLIADTRSATGHRDEYRRINGVFEGRSFFGALLCHWRKSVNLLSLFIHIKHSS